MAKKAKAKAKAMKQYKADERARMRAAGYVRFEAWVHRDELERVRGFVERINQAHAEAGVRDAAKNTDK